jgi:hypothetical protein
LLVSHLPQPLLEVLKQALDAHRRALALDPDNADTLFNTAQVLTAVGEAYAKDPNLPDQYALRPLEEALELQNKCLAVQELRFDEHRQQQDEAAAQLASHSADVQPAHPNDHPSEPDDMKPADSGMEDQWFTVLEPITNDTLLDTVLAQLGTLTTLCSVIGSLDDPAPNPSLAWIEEYSTKLINVKLQPLLQNADSERSQEIALARANFVSELLKAGYNRESVSPETYKRERDEAFRAPALDLERNLPALTANANSLIAFNSALAEGSTADAVSYAALRWSALSAAIANMANAAKLADALPDDIAEAHFLRGNCSLLQFQLGRPPVSHQTALSNGPQLLKNADTFYRNASKLYQDRGQKDAAHFRSGMAQALLSGIDISLAAAQISQGKPEEWIRDQFEDMLDEGLIVQSP